MKLLKSFLSSRIWYVGVDSHSSGATKGGDLRLQLPHQNCHLLLRRWKQRLIVRQPLYPSPPASLATTPLASKETSPSKGYLSFHLLLFIYLFQFPPIILKNLSFLDPRLFNFWVFNFFFWVVSSNLVEERTLSEDCRRTDQSQWFAPWSMNSLVFYDCFSLLRWFFYTFFQWRKIVVCSLTCN